MKGKDEYFLKTGSFNDHYVGLTALDPTNV